MVELIILMRMAGEQIVIKYYNAIFDLRKEGNKVEIIPEGRGWSCLQLSVNLILHNMKM